MDKQTLHKLVDTNFSFSTDCEVVNSENVMVNYEPLDNTYCGCTVAKVIHRLSGCVDNI